jgi:hypothetical protein
MILLFDSTDWLRDTATLTVNPERCCNQAVVRMTIAKRRVTYTVLLLISVVAGLVWRLVPLDLSPFWFKYGGSALWAMALYWLIAICLPRLSAAGLSCLAGVVAAVVEFSRLWHVPSIDGFRLTLAGRLLLGRYFSLKNIAAYWLAIALAAVLDRWLVRSGSRSERQLRPPPIF